MTAMLPASWTIRAFACEDPLPGPAAVAHLFERTGGNPGAERFTALPATAFGSTCNEARERLTAFLVREITRKQASGRARAANLTRAAVAKRRRAA